MTHDPLCPTQTMCKCKDQECWDCRDVVLCQCALIAEVRADERQKVKDAVWRLWHMAYTEEIEYPELPDLHTHIDAVAHGAPPCGCSGCKAVES